MKTFLFGLAALVCSAWYVDLASSTFPAAAACLWIDRQEGLYLSGLLSIACCRLSKMR